MFDVDTTFRLISKDHVDFESLFPFGSPRLLYLIGDNSIQLYSQPNGLDYPIFAERRQAFIHSFLNAPFPERVMANMGMAKPPVLPGRFFCHPQ
ncbi:hypothetical protein [Paenibacillus sp. J2TS4]|uniref:hypothetical protein n=1 Tax=Paenibacillus sp. J2TS4 TaxID=2807194 RepID=UPI001BCF9097|nr:hypothetical protein [Paenibacillus sp. J2TS4]